MDALVKSLGEASRALIASRESSIEDCTAAVARDLLSSSLFHDRVSDLRSVSTSPCAKDNHEAERLKTDGNAAFKREKWDEAIDLYTKALRHASPSPLAAIIFSNRAAALQKLSLIREAEQDCALALACDKTYAKAWHRRAGLLTALRDLPAAARCLREAVARPSAAASWQRELEEIEKRIAAEPPESGGQERPAEEEAAGRAAAAAGADRSTPASTSAELPAASSSVELETSPTSGRGLRARAAIRRGEVVLSELPYAAAVHKPARALRCHACFARLPRAPVPCSGCSAALFCSPACLRWALFGDAAPSSGPPSDAWWWGPPSGASCGEHAHECGGAAWAAALPTEAVLAARVAVRAARERERREAAAAAPTCCPEPLPEGSQDFRAVERLAYHWPDVPPADRAQWLVLSAALAECLRDAPAAAALGASGAAAAAASLCLAFSWLRANSFAVTDDFAEASWSGAQFEQIRVAQALYPTASLLNHACAPSAHASFRGRRICVRAARGLPPGAPLLIAYGPQVGQQPAAKRRRLLRTSHAFECACAACALGAAADAELDGLRCSATPGCDGAVPCADDAGGGGPCGACGRAPEPAARAESLAAVRSASEAVRRVAEIGGPFAKDAEALSKAVDALSAHAHARSRRLAEARDALAHALCARGDFAAALPPARAALGALRAHYPEGSVVLAHECAKAAGVAAGAAGSAGDDGEQRGRCAALAARLAEEALEGFEAHYGADFPRCGELRALLREVRPGGGGPPGEKEETTARGRGSSR